jgi:hypothetical protein
VSGKPWTPERRAAFSESMRKRWAGGAYAKRKPPSIDPADRRRRSEQMKALNARAATDAELKRAMVKGATRARRKPAWRAVQALVMADIMSRPENKAKAAAHCRRINRNPRTRKRQWAARRRRKRARGAAAEQASPPIGGG